MSVTILGLKTCDTCRKAQKALPEATLRDLRTQPLSSDEITELLARFGGAAINRASATWRGLSAAQRAQASAALLAAHPALMKRPLIRTGTDWHLGWTPAVRAALGVA